MIETDSPYQPNVIQVRNSEFFKDHIFKENDEKGSPSFPTLPNIKVFCLVNEPKFLFLLLLKIAEMLKKSVGEVSDIIYQNSLKAFYIKNREEN